MWSILKQGDVIEIIAPSFNASKNVLNKIQNLISKLGYQVQYPKDLCIQYNDGNMVSNSAKYRANHFLNAMNDTVSKAVWCLQGGNGCKEILEFIKNAPKPKISKPLIGFSDITALHMFIQKNWKQPSIHAIELADNQDIQSKFEINRKTSISTVLDILSGKTKDVSDIEIYPINDSAKQLTLIESETIVGGNVQLIMECEEEYRNQAKLNIKNRIVFFESYSTPLENLKQFFTSRVDNGWLQLAKGIIIGDLFLDNQKEINLLLNKLLQQYNCQHIPLFETNLIGHGDINLPVVYNTKAKIQKSSENKFILSTSFQIQA